MDLSLPRTFGPINLKINLDTAQEHKDDIRDTYQQEEKFENTVDKYDEYMSCSATVADAMNDILQAGERRIEMAELISQIEKTPGSANYLKIQLAEMLIGQVTDEVQRQAEA